MFFHYFKSKYSQESPTGVKLNDNHNTKLLLLPVVLRTEVQYFLYLDTQVFDKKQSQTYSLSYVTIEAMMTHK